MFGKSAITIGAMLCLCIASVSNLPTYHRLTLTFDSDFRIPNISSHQEASEKGKDLDTQHPAVSGDIIYSEGRKDRSGSVITDMLYAHAYAFHHNLTYGGACYGEKNLPKKDIVYLIQQMGWTGVLKFGCPGDNSSAPFHREIYRDEPGDKYFTPAWRKHLQTELQGRQLAKEPKDRLFQIAVHIRRGDVTPCRHRRRYLSNQHFMKLIQKYLPPDDRPTEVTIFSESDSYEPFDVFRQANYTLKLDTDLPTVWKAFVSADVLILSRSFFSFVPAAVNPNTVVATKFSGFAPLTGWEQVDEGLVQETENEITRLGQNGCIKEAPTAAQG